MTDRLHAGGTIDLEGTTHPIWIVGYGPSARRFQVLWNPGQQAYYVSRWTAADAVAEALGAFPHWEVTIDHALQA
jgi:hypothetical protein